MSAVTHILEERADILAQNVAGWESSALQRLGRRIKRIGKMSPSDVQTINNIADVKEDMDAIIRDLATVTGKNISDLKTMYGDAIEQIHEGNRSLYDYRGKKFKSFAENNKLQSMVAAFAKSTGGTMLNLTKSAAVNLGTLDENGNFVPLQEFFVDTLDRAVIEVSSGTSDFYSAMRRTIASMGGGGIRVNYGSGVTRRVDTVVRQALLWGAKQTANAYSEMIGREIGCDGIEVDWHDCPRLTHEFMQGKQFVIGKSRTINGTFFESADEALERLADYGCLHFKTPIICGISPPIYSPEQLEELNKRNEETYEIGGKEYTRYEAVQMMRRLESGVRNEKTTRDVARSAGDKALTKKCTKRIDAYKAKYDDISRITGIAPDKRRMTVSRGNNSVNSLKNSGGSGIIKSGAVSGARNPYGDKAKAHAEKYYGLVRTMKTDVSSIAKTTGFSEEQIQDVKNFIFYEKHDLGGEELELFKPDYMMGESWKRLIEGKPEPHDITLINHEIMERDLIKKGYTQDEAHIMTSKIYNYDKEATEFYDKIEKYSD